jgi:hypothetical protein
VGTIRLEFEYAKENYRLELASPEEILHPSAEILTFANGSSLHWTGAHPDCFLTGSVTSHRGIASMSICGNVVGVANELILSDIKDICMCIDNFMIFLNLGFFNML